MQFCQVFFLNNYICDIIVLDKIGKRVYNVIRYHQGGLYTYTRPIYTFPPRGIPGNIVGIFSPEIQPNSSLHGFWGFSGFCIYSIQDTPPATRIGCTDKKFVYVFWVYRGLRSNTLLIPQGLSREILGLVPINFPSKIFNLLKKFSFHLETPRGTLVFVPRIPPVNYLVLLNIITIFN